MDCNSTFCFSYIFETDSYMLFTSFTLLLLLQKSKPLQKRNHFYVYFMLFDLTCTRNSCQSFT